MALPKDFKTYRAYGAWKLHHMPEEPDQGEGGGEPEGGEEQEGGRKEEEDEGEGEAASSPA